MTIQEKFKVALDELIVLGMDGGMTTYEMADVLEAEIPKLRRPFANPAENEA